MTGGVQSCNWGEDMNENGEESCRNNKDVNGASGGAF